jgi:hypothetical protein
MKPTDTKLRPLQTLGRYLEGHGLHREPAPVGTRCQGPRLGTEGQPGASVGDGDTA